MFGISSIEWQFANKTSSSSFIILQSSLQLPLWLPEYLRWWFILWSDHPQTVRPTTTSGAVLVWRNASVGVQHSAATQKRSERVKNRKWKFKFEITKTMWFLVVEWKTNTWKKSYKFQRIFSLIFFGFERHRRCINRCNTIYYGTLDKRRIIHSLSPLFSASSSTTNSPTALWTSVWIFLLSKFRKLCKK